MTFTFNMTVTAKTETMLQDEMQQELLNLIGKYIAALPTEVEADRALKVWKSRFISQTYCGGGSS
jgi:coproporphyrinogen III oxidase-like Fe-S oxidoreductase